MGRNGASFQRYSAAVGLDGITRNVTAAGDDVDRISADLARQLAGDDLKLALVFADWRLEPARLAAALQRAIGVAPVVGCTTIGVVPSAGAGPAASAIGFYGDWLRVGVGVAMELSKSPLARSRDAVVRAARGLGLLPEALDPQRHVALTLVDGTCGQEEAFCIGSAATAPQIRFVGGSASTQFGEGQRAFVWANGEALADAGVIIVLDCDRMFDVVTSSHLIPTDVRTVVTAAGGRIVDELDGRPAATRLGQLLAKLGATFDPAWPTQYSFARFVDGVPYVRSMTHVVGSRLHFASGVEVGHVLHVMRPGDLIAVTRRDLASAAERVGGQVDALIAFSCLGRHLEAAALGLEGPLAAAYADHPTVGIQSFGEQTGILFVNHTLTALAIGGMA